MEKLKNTMGANEGAACRPRWLAMIRWIVRGTLMLIAGFILLLTGLIVPEYLRAGQAPGESKRIPSLLEPASAAKSDPEKTTVTLAQAATNASKAALKASGVGTRNDPTSGSAPSDATPPLKYKPFINDKPVLDGKLNKEQKDRINKRFDDLLTRIARYEEEKGSLNLEAVREEVGRINGDFFGIALWFSKLLGLPVSTLTKGVTPYPQLSSRINEYWYWFYPELASLEAHGNHYDQAAMYIRTARSSQELAYIFMRATKPDETDAHSIADLHQSPEYQAMWQQEIYYWRKSGVIKSVYGIGQSVLNLKLREIGWWIKKRPP